MVLSVFLGGGCQLIITLIVPFLIGDMRYVSVYLLFQGWILIVVFSFFYCLIFDYYGASFMVGGG